MTHPGEKKFFFTVRKHMRRILTQRDNEVFSIINCHQKIFITSGYRKAKLS